MQSRYKTDKKKGGGSLNLSGLDHQGKCEISGG